MQKRKLIKIIAMVLLTMSGVLTISGFVNKKLAKPYTVEHTKADYDLDQFKLTEETIKHEMMEKLNLNILDIQFSQMTKIEGGFDGMGGLFENDLEVKFFGTARYSLDLQGLKIEQIRIDEDNIKIMLPAPKVDIIMNEKLTQFRKQKGALAFLDVTVEPSHMERLKLDSKIAIEDKAKEMENMDEAKKRASEKIQSLINTLTREVKSVEVIWV